MSFNFLTWVKGQIVTDETFVLNLVASIKKEEAIVLTDAQSALAWVKKQIPVAAGAAANFANILADVSVAVAVLDPPEAASISAAAVALQIASGNLTAFSNSLAQPTTAASTVLSVQSGYQALKGVQAATAALGAAVAKPKAA